MEARAIGTCFKVDLAVVCFDDGFDDSCAQSRALTFAVGDERFEETCLDFWRDAGAIVDNFQMHMIICFRGGDFDCALDINGVDGIHGVVD